MVVLLTLIVAAYVSESIGIHAFFGAFLAGIIVPKEGNFAVDLAPRIELVVVDFLLPLYFANAGLKMNVRCASSLSVTGMWVDSESESESVIQLRFAMWLRWNLNVMIDSALNGGSDAGVTIFIIVIACVAKFVPTCVVSRLTTGQPWRLCIGLGLLMNTRGLVQLIVLGIGLNANILSIRMYTMMVVRPTQRRRLG